MTLFSQDLASDITTSSPSVEDRISWIVDQTQGLIGKYFYKQIQVAFIHDKLHELHETLLSELLPLDSSVNMRLALRISCHLNALMEEAHQRVDDILKTSAYI